MIRLEFKDLLGYESDFTESAVSTVIKHFGEMEPNHSYVVYVSSQGYSNAFEVRKLFMDKHNIEWFKFRIELSLQYNPDEWSMLLLKSCVPFMEIHSIGA